MPLLGQRRIAGAVRAFSSLVLAVLWLAGSDARGQRASSRQGMFGSQSVGQSGSSGSYGSQSQGRFGSQSVGQSGSSGSYGSQSQSRPSKSKSRSGRSSGKKEKEDKAESSKKSKKAAPKGTPSAPFVSKAAAAPKGHAAAAPKSVGAAKIILPSMAPCNTIYLDPGDVTIPSGREFDTRILYSNPKRQTVDSFRVVLKYDPEVLMPTGVQGRAVEKYLQSPGDFSGKVLGAQSRVVIEGKLKGMPPVIESELARIRWKALAPSSAVALQFIVDAKDGTQVLSGGEAALGDPLLENPGVVDGSAQVEEAKEAEGEDPSRMTEDLDYSTFSKAGANEPGRFVRLALQAPKREIKVGERFFVDIALDNAANVWLDNLGVIVEFDPAVLQVVDCDEGNWIEAGTNIYDAPYHERFPLYDPSLERRLQRPRRNHLFGGRLSSAFCLPLRQVRLDSLPGDSSVQRVGDSLPPRQAPL